MLMAKMKYSKLFLSVLFSVLSLNIVSIIVILQNEASLPYSPKKRQWLVLGPDGNSLPVAAMPAMRFPSNLTGDIGDYSVEVALGASGCEPKFFLRTYSQSYIFKPSRRGNAMNELISFHVDHLFGFNRVPPVFIHEIDLEVINFAISQTANALPPLLSCAMDFQTTKGLWILHNRSMGIHRVLGTRQILLRNVWQRAEIDRFVNRHFASGRLEMSPSIFGQREIDTRRMFDSLVGNWDRFNNDFSMQQVALDESEITENLLIYIDNNGLSSKTPLEPFKYCRLYHNVVENIRKIPNPRKEILGRIMTDSPLVKELVKSHTVGLFEDLRPLNYINQRRELVLAQVEDCIKRHGFHHVFVDQ
jgi:hypothetical protein